MSERKYGDAGTDPRSALNDIGVDWFEFTPPNIDDPGVFHTGTLPVIGEKLGSTSRLSSSLLLIRDCVCDGDAC